MYSLWRHIIRCTNCNKYTSIFEWKFLSHSSKSTVLLTVKHFFHLLYFSFCYLYNFNSYLWLFSLTKIHMNQVSISSNATLFLLLISNYQNYSIVEYLQFLLLKKLDSNYFLLKRAKGTYYTHTHTSLPLSKLLSLQLEIKTARNYLPWLGFLFSLMSCLFFGSI